MCRTERLYSLIQKILCFCFIWCCFAEKILFPVTVILTMSGGIFGKKVGKKTAVQSLICRGICLPGKGR